MTPQIMAETSDIDRRLADEVTTLSTKLVTEVAKLLHLEETILQLRKENAQFNTRLLALESVESEYETVLLRYDELKESHGKLTQEKVAAEAKNKQLEGEIEDLTASLFNEANEMVSNASREAYNFKLKNRKLIEELVEKDLIIENLQEQLRDLKDLFVRMEDQQKSVSRAETPRLENGSFARNPEPVADDSGVLLHLLFGVKGRAVRFDLQTYQLDFKAFVFQLIKKEFTFDLASLKTLKYFRKLWTDELEPSIPVIPSLTGNMFMNRWSKGKSFWTLLVEGKAIIEPVAGINETFKLTYKGAKRGTEVPVAIKDACAFCGEHKDDLLEHARLYSLKLYGPATETDHHSGAGTTEIGGEPHAVVGTYPLCNFCLVKLRAICTFFAKLRLLHSNIYKLPQNSLYDDVAYVSSFQFKRSTEFVQTSSLDLENEPTFMKLYLMLLALRAKIFWSRIGFWDTDEDVESLNVDEIQLDAFRTAVQDNVAFHRSEVPEIVLHRVPPAASVLQICALEAAMHEPHMQVDFSPAASEPIPTLPEPIATESPKAASEPRCKVTKSKKKGRKTPKNETLNSSYEPEIAGKANGSSVELEGDSDFQDSVETFDGQHTLQRKKSKSKEFKAKINKDLDDTLTALQESIE